MQHSTPPLANCSPHSLRRSRLREAASRHPERRLAGRAVSREPRPTRAAAVLTALERAMITGNFVPAQRDLIVERALERDADVLIMCDDDMVLPPDVFVRFVRRALCKRRACALAGALYYSRDGFRPMAIDGWDPADTRTAVIPAFDERAGSTSTASVSAASRFEIAAAATLAAAVLSRARLRRTRAPAGCASATKTISSARACAKDWAIVP